MVRLLPVDAASRWMGGLWAWLGPMNRRHQRALDHLAAALPDLSADQWEQIARRSWHNLGCILAETVNIHRIARQRDRIEISADTAAKLDPFKSEPCIFVSLHTGNWELLGVTAGQAGFKLAGVYQSMTNPSVERLSLSLRAPYYPEGMLAKGHGTARELVSILKRGGSLAFLADHRDLRGIQVPFFGRAAYSTPIPASLARNYNVPIIAARLIRTGPARFKLDVEPVPVPVTENRKQDIADADDGLSCRIRTLDPRLSRSMDVDPPQMGRPRPSGASQRTIVVQRKNSATTAPTIVLGGKR